MGQRPWIPTRIPVLRTRIEGIRSLDERRTGQADPYPQAPGAEADGRGRPGAAAIQPRPPQYGGGRGEAPPRPRSPRRSRARARGGRGQGRPRARSGPRDRPGRCEACRAQARRGQPDVAPGAPGAAPARGRGSADAGARGKPPPRRGRARARRRRGKGACRGARREGEDRRSRAGSGADRCARSAGCCRSSRCQGSGRGRAAHDACRDRHSGTAPLHAGRGAEAPRTQASRAQVGPRDRQPSPVGQAHRLARAQRR